MLLFFYSYLRLNTWLLHEWRDEKKNTKTLNWFELFNMLKKLKNLKSFMSFFIWKCKQQSSKLSFMKKTKYYFMNIRILSNSLLKTQYITIHWSVKVIIKTASHRHKYSHELVVGLELIDFFPGLYSYHCGVWQRHKTIRHLFRASNICNY